MKCYGFALFVFFALVSQTSAEERRLNAVASPPQVSRTKSCPAGFQLVGKKCETTEVVEPNYVCPPGTSLVDGQCSTFNRATRQCPAPFRLTGETCSTTESTPADFQCNTGSLDDSGRSCRQTKEVAPVCPAGFVEQSKQCVRYSPKQKQCPSGYTMQGKDCARAVSFPAEPTCPASFSLAGEKTCTKLVPIPPRCESGYTMEGQECVRSFPKRPSSCPKGFTPVGSSCQQQHQYPVRLVCPTGTDLNANNQCAKHVPVPPTCPAGSKRGSSGQCEIPVAQEPICEEGYQLIKNGKKPICRLTSNFPTSPRCASGFSLVHGKCKKATAQQPIQRCAVGVLENGWCSTQSTTAASLGCPEGFRLTKGPACIQDVAYDCSQTTTRTVCEMPSFVSQILDTSTSKNQRFLNADYKQKGSFSPPTKSAPIAAASQKKTESKDPICHQVPQSVPRTCTKIEKAPLRYFCPDGSETQGEQCITRQTSETQLQCTSGRLDQQTGQCISLSVIPAEQVCPTGSQKQGKSCVQVDTRDASMVCPVGSQSTYGNKGGSGCVFVKEEVNHPARVVLQVPQSVCDSGTQRGNVCVDQETIPRETECPPKTEDRKGRCVKTTALIAPPPRQETVAARFVCADGKSAAGKSCSARESVPVSFFCQAGGQLDGERCVHSAAMIYPPALILQSAATPTCPKGFSLQGNKCVTTVTEPAQKVCPNGFSAYQDGARECVKNHSQVSVCPAGTIQSKSGCTKKTYAQPQVVEIKECTKGQPGC